MKSSYFHDISIYMVHIQMNYHAISIVHVKRCKAQTEDAPVCCVRVYVLLLLRSQMDGPVSLVIALSLINSPGRYGSHTKTIPSLPAHGGWQAN